MKLRKLISIVIVLLLSCSISYAKNDIDDIPLRARSEVNTDTVTVPIRLIKLANIKMIERNYYKRLSDEKDSLLFYKNNYIQIQKNIIKLYKIDADTQNDMIYTLSKDIKKQRKRTKVITIGSISIVSLCLIGLIIK